MLVAYDIYFPNKLLINKKQNANKKQTNKQTKKLKN
jgi:hypothetical protein